MVGILHERSKILTKVEGLPNSVIGASKCYVVSVEK